MNEPIEMLSAPELVQEEQYSFPYHYLGLYSELHRRILHRHYLSELDRIVRLASPRPGSRWLDIGCGDGRLAYELRGSSVNYVGIDHSSRALSFARAFCPDGTFINGSASGDILEGKFDWISMVQVLEHIQPDRVRDALGTIATQLAPGGRALVSVPSVNLPLSAKHFQHFDPVGIKHLLAEFLHVDSILGHISARSWRRHCRLQTLCSAVWPLRNKLSAARLLIERTERHFDAHVECRPEDACTLIAVLSARTGTQ